MTLRSSGKWVQDADTRHGFTGIQVFAKKHVSSCDMRGDDQSIIKGNTACLVQIQSGADDRRRDLDDFKLLIQIKLGANMLHWQSQFLRAKLQYS